MEKILLVDDEQSVLDGFRRQLRNKYQIETAISGPDGLKKIASSGPFSVIISDMRMPVMDGIAFLINVGQRAPDSIRMMLTGNADQKTAIDAINRGAIFRFLAKPCSPENLAMAIDAGIKQYRLVTAEKELLEKTLLGSINILMDVLSLAYPSGFGQSMRMRNYAAEIARKLKLSESWQYELAAMLSSIGFINMPAESIERYLAGAPLSDEEEKMVTAVPHTTGTLLANIPRLSIVAAMITKRDVVDLEPIDFGSTEHNEMIRIGAKILKGITGFDILLNQDYDPKNAIRIMAKHETVYDKTILDLLSTMDVPHKRQVLELSYVKIHELQRGMIIDVNIYNSRKMLVVPKGYVVNETTVERLNNFMLNNDNLTPENLVLDGVDQSIKEVAKQPDTIRVLKPVYKW